MRALRPQDVERHIDDSCRRYKARAAPKLTADTNPGKIVMDHPQMCKLNPIARATLSPSFGEIFLALAHLCFPAFFG